MDFKPATKGHILLLPKQHADDLFGLPEDIASKVLPTAKKIALKMQKNLQFDGMNLVQNNGEIAGQTILHFHLHMIPRYINDGQKIAWVPTSPEDAELDRIKDQIVG
jgi:histidine triad (HIT) family protein